MTEATSREIIIGNVDARELYGAKNVYLEQIKAMHPSLRIIERGTTLKVIGPGSETEKFEKHLKGLIAYYDKYGHISKEVIEQSFAQGFPGRGEERQSDREVIVYGNNGMAGSGKTYTAIALAVRALRDKCVKRVILTRPAVEAGEKLGFLPGDLKEKLDPYLQPLYDALNDMIPAAKLQKYIEDGTVQIAPLAYMRGRTLDNAFVILDEAQNTTMSQIKMFLTRMGPNAKFIVTGDVTQVDLPRRSDSGLVRAMETVRGIEGIGFVEFDKRDIVRHQLVKHIVDAFDRRAESVREDKEEKWQSEENKI